MCSALVQLALVHFGVPETLERSKTRVFKLQDMNPFWFVALLKGPRTLRVLAAVLVRHCLGVLVLASSCTGPA